jgi:hypothetical protein
MLETVCTAIAEETRRELQVGTERMCACAPTGWLGAESAAPPRHGPGRPGSLAPPASSSAAGRQLSDLKVAAGPPSPPLSRRAGPAESRTRSPTVTVTARATARPGGHRPTVPPWLAG